VFLNNNAVLFGASFDKVVDNLERYLGYEFQVPGTMCADFDVWRVGKSFIPVPLS
jgi:hypothetical protein